MKPINFILFGMIFLSSCLASQEIDFRTVRVNVKDVKTKTIDLALLDHRVAVVTMNQKPFFVGYMRSGVGIPWPVYTKGNNNFMDDLAYGIIESLKSQNITATNIQTNWDETEDGVKSKLLLSNGEKKIFFVIHELHSDGYGKITLYYNIDLYIYDKAGTLLSNKLFKGETELGGNAIWGPGDYKTYTPEFVSNFFGTMINDTAIIKAINNN